MKVLRLVILTAVLGVAAWLYKTRYLDQFDLVEAGVPVASASGLKAAGAPAGTGVRVLFIGNSLTYSQNMPAMLVGLARAGDVNLAVEQHAPAGATLAQHATNADVLAKLDAGGWDAVVIQEQSQRPAFRDEQVRSDSDPGVATLVRRARSASPGAKILFYMHFAHRHGDRANAPTLPEVSTYDGMQQRLNATYRRWAREQGGTIVPVGAAWAKVRRERPDIELYQDDSHPSRAGAYLVACLFYLTLFEQSPVGSSFNAGLDAAIADAIAQAALETYKVEP